MDISTFDALGEASQLSFTDSEKEAFLNGPRGLNSLIAFAGIVKQYDCVYDANAEVGIRLNALREDKAEASRPPEELLANTEPMFDCYAIPKLME
jgi:Asp-tRNA(Asn)/Glu-tRNA(Gln) amidotransferase C subunit